ncbi:MAG: hypothetical protein ABIK73_06920 [candidate division WOR-3 bacterium]
MCHIVSGTLPSVEGFYRPPYLVSYLGVKKMEFDEGLMLLSPFYFRNRIYSVNIIDDMYGYRCLSISEEPEKQGVVFRINTCEEDKETVFQSQVISSIVGGLHVSPFCLSVPENHTIDTRDMYIVLFEPKDIVFYDGKDISVRRFHIMDSSFLESRIRHSAIQKYYGKCYEHNDYLIERFFAMRDRVRGNEQKEEL